MTTDYGNSTPHTYRTKPATVQAMRWHGGNADDIRQWMSTETVAGGFAWKDDLMQVWVAANSAWVPVTIGEWILMDRHGFYPCKDDVFHAKYELDEGLDY